MNRMAIPLIDYGEDVVAEGRSLKVRLHDYDGPSANPKHDPKPPGSGGGIGGRKSDHDVEAEGRSLKVRLYDVDYQDPTANPGHDPKTKGGGRGGGVIRGKKKYKP
ncbi:hypothetical protein QJS10_CPA07g01129 [Acorus calamus]|uniref:Uncharacterized protein n=1 Tax=Acorus calamus TaxID=4465 RepID=A0AAV9EFI0_ACOCL|nr:hypothetical protein QJS10_CPA07g01129 [Acorus calamus]